MKWFNHIAIAGGICFAANPALVPVAVVGGTAPDWMEWVANKEEFRSLTGFRGRIKHREQTHVLMYWLLATLAFAFVWDFHNVGFWFSMGGLIHCFTDLPTAKGIKLMPWSSSKATLFGAKLRHGEPGEYFVAAGVIAVSLFVSSHFQASNPGAPGFVPFFYNWSEEYRDGYIDGSEWRANRFRFI